MLLLLLLFITPIIGSSRSPQGSPAEPKCGFSKQVIKILDEQNVIFGHFDILKDDEVRQGLKTFSNWPTYPQVKD